MQFLCILLAGLFAAIFPTGPSKAADPVDVLFRNKPPYHYLDGDRPAGFLYDCVRDIFQRAGIEARFQEAPTKRIVRSLQEEPRTVCTFSWYKLEERLAYARFSRPIYQDRPQILITAPAFVPAIAAHRSLAKVMADKSLRLGVINGISYGPALDQAIAQFAGKLDSATIDPPTLAAKVASGHVQFAFMDQDDFDYLKGQSLAALNRDYPGQGAAMQALVAVPLPDMPPGLTRHIMCSKPTSTDLIARLDRAIGAARCPTPERAYP